METQKQFAPPRFVLGGKLWEKLKRALTRKQREFEKMTPREKRVAIARDVIDQIEARKLIATSVYFDLSHTAAERMRASHRSGSVDVAMVTAQAQCRVCGIGSLFVAAIERADNLKFKDFSRHDHRDAEVTYLRQWFDEATLDRVEQYFERKTIECGVREGFRSAAPVSKHASPILVENDNGRRLTMIMENIVSNRGTFDPTRGKHGRKVN
jgi:hypothetical protein